MTSHIEDFKRGFVLAGMPLDEPIVGAVTQMAEL
jgi:hypothetical protein